MKRSRLILYFLLTLSTFFSQNRKADFSLYFEINQIQSEQNMLRLDSFINSLNAKTVYLNIYGYADYLSQDSYNTILSKNRADAVKKSLNKSFPSKVNVLQCKGFGETYSKEESNLLGESSQRRVDLVIERVVPMKEVDTRPIRISEPVEDKIPEGKETENLDENSAPEPNDDVSAAPLKLENLKKGDRVKLEGLSFEPGRHIMLRQSVPVLYKLLKTLQENKTLKIEIQGHICCYDGFEDGYDYDSKNRRLSTNRAKAVYDFLVSKGISAKRLSYRGFGHSKPKVDPERSPSDEQQNRRVEIEIIEN